MISSERKARLIWHCRRGMLELDILLSRFIRKDLDNINEQQFSQVERLLMHADPDIHAWLMGYQTPVDQELAKIVCFIRSSD